MYRAHDEVLDVLADLRMLVELDGAAREQAHRVAGRVAAMVERLLGLQ